MSAREIVLGIESSCDDTSAAIIVDGVQHSNVIARQKVHERYGGVVPELASRAHQSNILPVVHQAIKEAGVLVSELSAIGYTRGPGLMGSLLVGSMFAKGLAIARDISLIEVNHMQAHILAHFIRYPDRDLVAPQFPFIALTVSGGHTQLVLVKDFFEMKILGQTKDDAAGEAFDKVAKTMGFAYPGGPVIDRLAKKGDPDRFHFPKAKMQGLDFSFSGLKTSFLYTVRDGVKENPKFIEANKNDLAASVQKAIVDALMAKLKRAIRETGVNRIALAGGVSANNGLRNAVEELQHTNQAQVFLPQFEHTTDNGAMIAMTAYLKLRQGFQSNLNAAPKANLSF
jgi:N6-L-threonylcarbamoyladenine synthase